MSPLSRKPAVCSSLPPPKPLHYGAPDPYMGMGRPECVGFPFLCSFPSKSLCQFASSLAGKKSRMGEAERIRRMWLLETFWDLVSHGHPPQWGQEIPVDEQLHSTAIASIPSLQGMWVPVTMASYLISKELQRIFWC